MSGDAEGMFPIALGGELMVTSAAESPGADLGVRPRSESCVDLQNRPRPLRAPLPGHGGALGMEGCRIAVALGADSCLTIGIT